MLIFPVFDVDDMVDMIIGEIEGSQPPMTNLHSDCHGVIDGVRCFPGIIIWQEIREIADSDPWPVC